MLVAIGKPWVHKGAGQIPVLLCTAQPVWRNFMPAHKGEFTVFNGDGLRRPLHLIDGVDGSIGDKYVSL